jgi:PKD repeat protein
VTGYLARRVGGAWTTILPSTPPAAAPLKPVIASTVTGAVCKFDGSASTGPIVSYAWAYGDGKTGTGVTPSHTYAASGTYTVTLTVTSSGGATAVATGKVAVTVSGVEPSGPGITAFESLTGSTFTAKLNSVPSGQQVAFGAGTFEWQDFAQNSTGAYSGDGFFCNTPSALLGTSRASTVLRMTPGSSTKTTDMSASTSSLKYAHLNPTTTLVQDLTLQGVSIGPVAAGSGNIYNGFFLYQIAGFTMNRVLVRAIPGSGHVNPGETFGIDGYHGSNHHFTDVEVDGAGIGATAFGPNFHTGTYTLDNCNAHDNPYSAGVAAYQCSGTIQLNRFRSVNNHNLLNFEQNADGTVINVVSPILQGAGSFDMYIGAYSGSSVVTISDPVDDTGAPRTTLAISCNPLYGGQTNTQQRSDIKVLVGGVDRTSSIVSWH